MKTKVISLLLVMTLLCNGVFVAPIFAKEKDSSFTEENFPDPVLRNYLLSYYDKNKDNTLSSEEMEKVTYIGLKNKGVTSLKGIEYLKNISYLMVDENHIEEADFSKNLKLESLHINNNRLTSIKLPNEQENYELKYLDVFANQLTSLDTHNLKALGFLHCDDNKITQLDLSDNPLKDGHGFVAMHNQLEKIVLPNNGLSYPFEEYLAEQQEHDGYKTYWYDDKEMHNDITSNKEVLLQGQTLYAQYRPISYTLLFEAGIDAEGKMNPIKAHYDAEIKLPKNEFVPRDSNQSFFRWKDEKGRLYKEGQVIKNLTIKDKESIQFIPVWIKKDAIENTYKVYFHDTKNESEIIEAQEFYYNTPSAIKLPSFVKQDETYIFKGWSKEKNGKVVYRPEQILDLSMMDVQNNELHLYAVWTKNNPPKIEAKDITLTQGDTFDPMKGVTAWDEEDGNLTEIIEIINRVDISMPGEYSVTYRVEDSNGLSVEVNRSVMVLPKQSIIQPVPTIVAEDIELYVGDSFSPLQGVSAFDYEKNDITNNIEIVENNVDTTKAGIYRVVYKVSDKQNATTKKTRIVSVHERLTSINKPPYIHAEDKVLKVNDAFTEEFAFAGVTAWDDGKEISDKLEIYKHNVDTKQPGTYFVTYRVEDEQGAASLKTIKVYVYPRITEVYQVPIINAENIELYVGDSFSPLQGVSAFDYEKNDITNNIEIVENNVDTTKAGVYRVVYKVSDKQNATVLKTIQVVVKEKEEDIPLTPEFNEGKDEISSNQGEETSVPKEDEDTNATVETIAEKSEGEVMGPVTGYHVDKNVWILSLVISSFIIAGIVSYKSKKLKS